MVGPLTPDEKDLREPDELFRRTNSQYYHWLNCGIRLAASGGSAMGVMALPLGHSRTYAKVEGNLTPASFWAAVKAGKTFATTGPMLTLQIDGREMGAILARSATETAPLALSVSLQSIETIQSIQLVHNGEIVRQEVPPEPKAGQSFEHQVRWSERPMRSGWYAARALYVSTDGRLRQAHTSPIYVSLEGKPIAFKKSAEYMLRWVDQLIEFANLPGRYQREADKAEVLALYEQARRFYENVATTATRVWAD